MVESALDGETHVRGFADRLGERFIVPQPSGSLLEHLQFRRDLASAPFFEPAVKERLARLANFRHATYTRTRRLQRSGERSELVLVSTHVPGRHLSEVLQAAGRNGFRPPTAAVLWLTRQLLTSVALLHDFGPDVFHGAIGPDRLILAGDGRVVVSEYVLGTAVEQAVRPWGVHHLWRELRLATHVDFELPGYGRRVDLLQIGLVTLAFLLGRPLTSSEFPEALAQTVEDGTEAAADGSIVPIRPELRAWIERMVGLDPTASFRTLVEGQKALAQLLQDGQYPASSGALQAFVDQCESAPWYQPAPEQDPASSTSAEVSPALEPSAVSTAGPELAGEQPPDPFGSWPATQPAGGASALFHPFQPAVEGPPSAAEQVSGASATDAHLHAPAGGPDVAAWAPTPAPEIRTLFTAPPPPATPSEGAGSAEGAARPETGGPAEHQPWSAHERFAPPAVPVPAPFSPPAPPDPPQSPERDRSFRPEPDPVPMPAAPAARPTSRVRHDSRATRTVRQPVPRQSWFTPLRVGILVGVLMLAVVLALVLPRLLAGSGEPAKGTLVVESVPVGAEVTVDGKEAGVTPARLELAPGAHKLEVRIGGSSRAAWVNVPEGGTLSQLVELPEAMERSALRVITHPSGLKVSVNGQTSGRAPAWVDGLQPGRHVIVVDGPFGPVEQEVSVGPGSRASVEIPAAGWIRIDAPFDLEVSERGRPFGNTAAGPVMVPLGRHHFVLANKELDVNHRQFVDVPATGKPVQVPFDAPTTGMMNLDADQPAEVWLDGKPIGQTPLTSVAVPLGHHQVVFRHATLGEVAYTVVVTLGAPARVSAAFTKKK